MSGTFLCPIFFLLILKKIKIKMNPESRVFMLTNLSFFSGKKKIKKHPERIKNIYIVRGKNYSLIFFYFVIKLRKN